MSALVLGSAQWGMSHGIANRSGQPSRDAVKEILENAAQAGVTTIDSAAGYGESEAVIGSLTEGDDTWRIITKLDPAVESVADVEASLSNSREQLRRPRLDTVLLHRWRHRSASSGALWQVLLQQRDAGTIGRLGVSATDPDEAMQALLDPNVEVMQVAAGLLDQRLWQRDFFSQAETKGVELFVRSAFLQGVAFMAPSELPAHLQPVAASLDAIDAWGAAHGRSRAELFLLFARQRSSASVVVGCETLEQLTADLAMWESDPCTSEELDALASLVGHLPDAVLDPSKWPVQKFPSGHLRA